MSQSQLGQTNLTPGLLAAVDYLAGQPDVVLVYLFGSRAAGRASPRSDTDLAVLLEPEQATFERRLALWNAVEGCLRGPVDLTLLNHSSLLLQQQVLKHGRLLYERSRGERVAYEVRVIKLWHDLKPMRDSQWADLRQAIREGRFGQRRRYLARAVDVTRPVRE